VVERRIRRDQRQCVLLLGWPGAPDPDTDRVPLLLLRELLNGQSGRLFDQLRNRRSLCYNAGFVGATGFGQGLLAAYVLTAPESESAARDALLDVLDSLVTDRVPVPEFERARAELVGNLLIGNQGNLARAARCVRDLVYGRGSDDLDRLVAMIRACTADAVRDVAERYLGRADRFEVVGSSAEPV
jgi:zinc protease